MPGYALEVLDATGKAVEPGTTGTLAVKLRCRPRACPRYGNDQRFRDSYLAEFPGNYTTSDAGYIDADGYVYVMARTDDVINVAGHRRRPGRWKRWWLAIATSPNLPLLALPTR